MQKCKRQVQFLGQEDPLEEEMVTNSSILPGEFHGQREGCGGLQSMGSQSVGHDSVHDRLLSELK